LRRFSNNAGIRTLAWSTLVLLSARLLPTLREELFTPNFLLAVLAIRSRKPVCDASVRHCALATGVSPSGAGAWSAGRCLTGGAAADLPSSVETMKRLPNPSVVPPGDDTYISPSVSSRPTLPRVGKAIHQFRLVLFTLSRRFLFQLLPHRCHPRTLCCCASFSWASNSRYPHPNNACPLCFWPFSRRFISQLAINRVAVEKLPLSKKLSRPRDRKLSTKIENVVYRPS
jgi:hypothetical protein